MYIFSSKRKKNMNLTIHYRHSGNLKWIGAKCNVNVWDENIDSLLAL